jgi:hypothetical protein
MADTIIDFEPPEAPDVTAGNDPLNLTTPIDGVSFWVSLNTPTGTPYAWLHEAGAPQTAFVNDDVPSDWDADKVGQFIGDSDTTPDGPTIPPATPVNLFMRFDTAITSLELDVYDWGDWMVQDGDTFYLYGYTDTGWTNLDTNYDSFVRSGSSDDTRYLSVDFDQAVKSAALVFISTGSDVVTNQTSDFDAFDGGWGVDNVTFSVVPEPATMSLLGLGVVGLAVRHVRRKRS